jgi:hypothetical protein
MGGGALEATRVAQIVDATVLRLMVASSCLLTAYGRQQRQAQESTGGRTSIG